MRTHSIKLLGEVGIRLFLRCVFTLLLFVCAAGHVNSGCFVSGDVAESCHIAMRPDHRVPPTAELQEEEFDEAIIPKSCHDVLPALALLQQIFLEYPACFPGVCFSRFPSWHTGVNSPVPLVLRC